MEVHHHPKVEKKNFKEYVLEFVMIFLAVTLGFIAENIREGWHERATEKEYVLSIRKDLAADVSSINIWLPAVARSIRDFDTLMQLLRDPANTSKGSEIYYYARRSTRRRIFSANNNTFSELRSSGNLRLLSNKKLVNGLMDFQKIIDGYLNLAAVSNKEAEMLYPSLADLFDASVFDGMTINRSIPNNVTAVDSSLVNDDITRPPGNPQLLKHDAADINKLIFYLHERKSTLVGQSSLLVQQRENAKALIELINKEYRLRGE